MDRITRTSPKFCIFGAGAIGGMITTLLARSGATVSVVARGQTLAALKSNGVCLITNGEMLQASVQVSEDPSELGVQDYVIIAVKALHCRTLRGGLAHCWALRQLSSPQ
jgi:2-dehydropantoate 2-reductase